MDCGSKLILFRLGSSKDYNKRKPPMKNTALIAFYSVLLNASITAYKGYLSWITNSDAIFADTIHGFSDLFSSLTILAGITISKVKTKKFPLGLYKIENLISVLTSIFIFLTGYEIAKGAIFSPQKEMIKHGTLAITGLLITIGVIFLFILYEKKKGKETNSPSLIADAEHWKSDIYSTIIVVSTLIGATIGIKWLDRVGAVIVVGFIAFSGWKIFLDSIKPLLDASVDRKTMDAIRKIISDYPEVVTIKTIHARNSGSFIFVDAIIILNVNHLKEAHTICEEIEKTIKQNVPFVERVLIHYEPVER